MEAHSLLRALAARVERIELLGEPERGLNNLIHAWAHLPVRLHAAAS